MSTYSDVIIADSPVGYWRLDDTSGTTAVATVGNNGTYTNTPTLADTSVSAGLGTAVLFARGSTEYAVAGANSASNAIADAISLECWFKITSGTTASFSGNEHNAMYLVSKGNNSVGLNMYTHYDEGLYLRAERDGVGTIVWSTGYMTENVWHHAVFTKNGATIKLYVDGADVSDNVVNHTCTTNTADIAIATLNNTTSGTSVYTPFCFNGSIDEVAIYDYALTSGQVTAHYTAATLTNVDADVAGVTWTGQDASISAGGEVSIATDTPSVTWTGQAATVVGSINLTVTVDSIANTEFAMPDLLLSHMDVLFDNPLAFWHVNNDDPTNIDDITGNGRDFNRTNGASTLSHVTGREGDPGYPGVQFPDTTTWYRSFVQTSGDFSFEFWCKGSTDNQAGNNYIWHMPGYGLTTTDGEVNILWHIGSLATGWTWRLAVSVYTAGNQVTANWNTGVSSLSSNLFPNAFSGWNHYAITYNATTGELILYFNGAAVASTTNTTGSRARMHLADGYVYFMNRGGWDSTGSLIGNHSYDDLALFDYVLTQGQIQGHAVGVMNTIISFENIANVTWTGLDATLSAGQNVYETASSAFNYWYGQVPVLEIDGFVGITAELTTITFAGLAPTLLSEASLEQAVTNLPTATFTALHANVITRPDELTFVLIDPDSIEFTAFDSTFLDTIDFGVLFQSQERVRAFRLGNTSPISTDFIVTAESLNPLLSNNVEFSLDKATWEEELTIGHVGANNVTDVIYVRLSIPEEAYAGAGSFVISVVQDG